MIIMKLLYSLVIRTELSMAFLHYSYNYNRGEGSNHKELKENEKQLKDSQIYSVLNKEYKNSIILRSKIPFIINI